MPKINTLTLVYIPKPLSGVVLKTYHNFITVGRCQTSEGRGAKVIQLLSKINLYHRDLVDFEGLDREI
jgi:hypothetical protein